MEPTPKPISENATSQKLRAESANLRHLLTRLQALSNLGLPIQLPEGVTAELDDLDRRVAEAAAMPDRFNALFAGRGWVAHEMMNADVMSRAVELHAAEGPAAAERALVDAMDDDAIRFGINRIKRLPNGSLRWPLLNTLRGDYAEGRYHAVVPNLIAQVDGLVNDVEPTGFFAESTDLVVEDSIAGHRSALQPLRKLLSRCTNKTRDEPLELPFRNGIVHGRELGFGNKLVAAKCWALLFAVSDMLAARRAPPPTPDPPPPTWGETFRQLRENEKNRAALDRWQARHQKVGVDLAPASRSADVAPDSPEHATLAVLEAVRDKNYGRVAKLTHDFSKDSVGKRAGDIRRETDLVEVVSFSLREVDHYAPPLAKVIVDVERRVLDKPVSGPAEFLLNHRSPAGEIAIPGEAGATWSVVQWSLARLLHPADA